MPIPQSVLYPPFNIVRCAYVEYQVTDLAQSKAFWVDALGYALTEETGDALYLRGMEERNHHSAILRKSETAGVTALGFKVFSEEDLDLAERFFKLKGLPCRFVQKPFQGRTLAATDPLGMPLEFFFKIDQAPSLLRQYGLHRSAAIQRIDHFNCFSHDVQASTDFYNELGFRTTEYVESEDGSELWATWMHRKGDVHDIAFTNGRGPRLHHIGVWVPSAMDVIRCCDVLSTTGWLPSMERGPGRHGVANAFFLYVLDPDGHRVELFTSDYLTVDPDFEPTRWNLRDMQRQTLWGAPAPRSWFEHGSQFAGVSLRDSALAAIPIIGH
jgi:catechol 2,3-dioxygenase